MGVLKIGIVGAGIGGLAAANALHQAGHDVVVFEQSKQFLRVGADINLTPNAVRALDGLGATVPICWRRWPMRFRRSVCASANAPSRLKPGQTGVLPSVSPTTAKPPSWMC